MAYFKEICGFSHTLGTRKYTVFFFSGPVELLGLKKKRINGKALNFMLLLAFHSDILCHGWFLS